MIPLTTQQAQRLQSAGWDQWVSGTPALWCDTTRQHLYLVQSNYILADYPCSTAAAGLGEQENSHMTPRGWHMIADKIGEFAPIGAVFESRQYINKTWPADYQQTADDLICSRILWLSGIEEGFNAGGNLDSYNRYIYIHGTNHEDQLGTPASHGCIRLSNSDVLNLFNRVAKGTKIWIDDGT